MMPRVLFLAGVSCLCMLATAQAQLAGQPQDTCRQDLVAQIQRYKNCQADSFSTAQVEMREVNRQVQEVLAERQRQLDAVIKERDDLKARLDALPPAKKKD